MPIQRLKVDGKEAEWYLPHQKLEPADAIVAMRKKVKEVGTEVGMDLNALDTAKFIDFQAVESEAKDELLQGLLIAAPRGGEAMLTVLEDELLCHATEELIGEQGTLTAPEE